MFLEPTEDDRTELRSSTIAMTVALLCVLSVFAYAMTKSIPSKSGKSRSNVNGETWEVAPSRFTNSSETTQSP